MSKEIDRLLAGLGGKAKKPQKPLDPLALFFRKILTDIGMTSLLWGQKMEEYLQNPRNGVRRNPAARATARSNLMRELKKPKITFDVFRKGTLFLNPVKAKLIYEAQWQDGSVTRHELELLDQTKPTQEGETLEEASDRAFEEQVREERGESTNAPIPRLTREERMRRAKEIAEHYDD